MSSNSVAPSRSRRVLVPLATLLAAATIAVGSGASFTSYSENPGNAYTTGTLTQSNSHADQAIFNLGNLKPGDTVKGTLTLTNSGTLPAGFTLGEVDAVNGFVTPANLTLTVSDVTVPTAPVQKWSGTFGTLGTLSLGQWAAGERHDYEFAVTLDPNASNAEQGKSATATYTWDSVQTASTTYTQP